MSVEVAMAGLPREMNAVHRGAGRLLVRCVRWLAALGLLVFTLGAAAAEVRNVLVLYSNGRLVQGNIEVERGLRSALTPAADQALTVFSEFLDRPEFGGPAYEQTVTDYLRQKYATRPPDVVVAVAKESLDFILRHRAELFPGVPVVHAAVFSSYLQSVPPLPADVLGVPVEYDPVGTLEQALRWHPNTRRLVFVTGATTRDREWEAQLRGLAPRFEDRVKVEFLAGLPTPEVLERLRTLPADSLVFTAGYYQGADGLKFTPRESAEAMALASAVPVYGTFSTFLGTGVVGGLVPSFEAMGRQAGQVVDRLLGGAAPSAFELPKVMPNELTLDWRQVRRWGIDEGQIPPDAKLQFREPTFWQAYQTLSLSVAAVVLLLVGLVLTLLLERRRRRHSELVVQGQRSELAHASRLAVAGELTASIAHEINQPLGAILASADAAEMLLQSGTDRREDLLRIVARIRRDDLRASEVIRRLRTLLAKHEPDRQPIEVNAAAQDAATLLEASARRRQVKLDVLSSISPTWVKGDPVQIQQVLINLILNAIDAVADLPEPRRVVSVAITTRASNVIVTVRDRGPGIAPQDLPKVFDSFFSTKKKGMGLGLSIARTIVEAHGGRISATNGPVDGAVLEVELPVRATSAVPKAVAA